jgi:RNA polymerase sigma factor (sigma-70 family)
MESIIQASNPLGSLGVLAQPGKKSRRLRRDVGANAQGVLGETQSSKSLTGTQSVANEYTRGNAVTALSDTSLVELALADDQGAFTELVERYKDAVQNLAYRMLGNLPEAEDVTQETFVRAYTQLATYKPVHKFSTWLLSIASHLSIDQLRRRRFLALPLEDVPFLEWIADAGTGPEQSALQGEQHDEIQTYLQRLPGKYRVVIVLRYWYDLSYEEISRMLDLTPTLVKARLHRARELLARYMKQIPRNEEEQVDALQRG